ncbi:hypothetical protein M758_12G006100 [Ceratodon purpureus]|nr:hypothetical protein M758_12G006100 [Ceratodon purpureus]
MLHNAACDIGDGHVGGCRLRYPQDGAVHGSQQERQSHALQTVLRATNIANMSKGLVGAKLCLCSLLNHPLAKSNGVVRPRIALGISQKCRMAVPKGFVCQGTHHKRLAPYQTV